MLCRNAAKFYGPKVILDGRKDSGNMCCGHESMFQLVFWKNWCWVLCVKDWMNHPGGYYQKVQKRASFVARKCIGAYSMWRYHWPSRVYWDFRGVYSTIKVTVCHGNSIVSSARQRQASFLLHSLKTQCVCAWLACQQSRSASCWKCMAHHERENQSTGTTHCRAAEVLYQARWRKKFHLHLISIPGFQTINKCN